jgi:hypothetical protein
MTVKQSNQVRQQILRVVLLSLLTLATQLFAFAQTAKENPARVSYITVKVDGLDIFYREAG